MVEKVKDYYVLASIDKSGKTVYLRYLLNRKWEITDDIERASKIEFADLAEEVLNNYYTDTRCYDDKFVIVKLQMTWTLIKE